MRSLVLLALLPLAAAPALAQSSPDAASGPVGGTAVRFLGTAGATIDTGADAAGQGSAGQAEATASGSDAAAATDSTGAAAAGITNATSSTAAAGSATAAVTVTVGVASTAGGASAPGATAAAGSATGSDSAAAASAAPSGTAAGTTASGGPVEFRTMIGDRPIEITGDKATGAFEQFRQTGTNPFHGDEAALAEGKKIYAKLCQACHMPDGSGRIGPSLTDDLWRNPRLETEAGRFEIIHSGGAGAMQAFHKRMSTDEILKVMAYIDTFRGG